MGVAAQQPRAMERWWTTFHDSTLDELVHRAVASNLSLEAATERVVEARAAARVAVAGLYPSAVFAGSYQRSNIKGQSLWLSGLDALWEVDVFGGVRRSVEAASASLQASEEDRHDVLVTLLGEVATDYIQLRGYQQQIAIAQSNLQIQVRNVGLTQDKKKLGTGTELDIAQSEALVASTKAAIESQKVQAQQTVYALSVLLGLSPTALEGELTSSAKIPDPSAVIPVGVPSELLTRRPDIRRAERQLAAATAQIGVATADLFPKFTLTGDLSLQGSQLSSLGTLANRTSTVGPNIAWPILDSGRIWANIKVQNARQAQAYTAYKQTVLAALLEVQNTLAKYAGDQRRRNALADAVTANQRAFSLATRRYEQGVTDFLSVLDAERSLFSSQDALVQSNRDIATDAVALYKALGGGWEIGEKQPVAKPSVR